jgi:hypothetical protein
VIVADGEVAVHLRREQRPLLVVTQFATQHASRQSHAGTWTWVLESSSDEE